MILLVDEQKSSEVAELIQKAEDRVELSNSRENAVGVGGVALLFAGGVAGHFVGDGLDLQGVLPLILGGSAGTAVTIAFALLNLVSGNRAEKTLADLKEYQRVIEA